MFPTLYYLLLTECAVSMGESNTVVSAYTLYGHLQQYCSHPLVCSFKPFSTQSPVFVTLGKKTF